MQLIAGLTADLRQALNLIYAKVDLCHLKAGSTIVMFRFVQHREQEEGVRLLEDEYLRQVEDKASRLYMEGRSVTHLIDAPRTLELTTQIAGTESPLLDPDLASTPRREYAVGSTVSMMDIECKLEKVLGTGVAPRSSKCRSVRKDRCSLRAHSKCFALEVASSNSAVKPPLCST